MIDMNKFITLFTKIAKIYSFKVTKGELYALVDKAFNKLDSDTDQELEIKDLLIDAYELYKSKKGVK